MNTNIHTLLTIASCFILCGVFGVVGGAIIAEVSKSVGLARAARRTMWRGAIAFFMGLAILFGVFTSASYKEYEAKKSLTPPQATNTIH